MVEHINVQDGGFAVEIATNLSGYGYFNQNQIEINNGTFETLADNGGAIRLAIYDGDFYMIGDVLLNDYNGEIYQNPHDYGGYNFQWIPAKEYIDWYQKYRPYLDAGYLTEWENWAYEHNRYDPFKHEIRHYLADSDRKENYIFREIIDEGCPDIHVYEQITSSLPYNEDIEDYIIYMWLDH